MFRKLVLITLGIFLAASIASAGTVQKTIIDDETISTGVAGMTSDTVNLMDSKKTAFFVDYDETQTGVVSAAMTVDVSYDGTNWTSKTFHDGAASYVTSDTTKLFLDDEWYYFYLDSDNNAPYARVKLLCTGCDATNDINVNAYCVTTR